MTTSHGDFSLRPGRRAIVRLLLFCLAALACDAQTIVLKPERLDFPCTFVRRPIMLTLEIHNTGTETINRINYEDKKSPFRPIQKDRDARSIPPGGKRLDTIVFDPRNAGPHSVQLVIRARAQSSSDEDDEIVATIPARGVAENPQGIDAEPQDVKFSPVRVNDTGYAKVTLFNRSCPPVFIDQISIGGDHAPAFRVVNPPRLPDSIPGNGKMELTVAFLPLALTPPRQAFLLLRIQDGRQQPTEITVDLEGKITPPGPSARPSRLDFGQVPINAISPIRRLGLIDPRGSGPLARIRGVRITGRDSSEFGFLLPQDFAFRKRGDTVALGVEFAPTVVSPKDAQLVVDFEDDDPVVVQLMGLGTAEPVGASPRHIDFGDVPLAETRTFVDTITLFNDTPGPTQVDRVEVLGPDQARFAVIGPATTVIPSGQTRVYTVSFTPLNGRRNTARAVFVLRSGIRLPVDLEGRGIGRITDVRSIEGRYEFGDVFVDSLSAPVLIGLVNLGNVADSVTALPALSGDHPDDFSVIPASSVSLPYKLLPFGRDTLWLRGTMTPRAPGEREAELRPQAMRATVNPVELRGNGTILRVTATPDAIDFQTVVIGRDAVRTITLRNEGTVPAIIDAPAVTGRNERDFTLDPVDPVTIEPGDDVTYRVTFRPTINAGHTARAEFHVQGGSSPHVDLTGAGLTGSVIPEWIDEPQHDFGPVAVSGNGTTYRIGIVNAGTVDDEIRSIGFDSPDSIHFSLKHDPLPAPLGASRVDTFWIDATFRPAEPGPWETNIVLRTQAMVDGTKARLLGTGTVPALPRGVIRAWIDTSEAVVNTPFPIRIILERDLAATEDVRRMRARLRYNPSAIHFDEKELEDAGLRIESWRYDTLELSRSSPTPLIGRTVLTLNARGLVTGNRENRVELLDLALRGVDDSIATGPGLVRLIGCDIDRGVTFGTASKVRSISPNPIGSEAVVRYYAAAGTSPLMAVIDVTGRVVMTHALPTGEGREEEAHLPLGDLQNGFYFIELRAGTQRSTIPAVIGD